MPTVLLTTTAAAANATVPAHTSTTATPAPFCLNCAFNFGHIMDGMDDSAAGALVVSIFVILLAAICFAVGCYAHVIRTHRKVANVYAAVKSTDDADEKPTAELESAVDETKKSTKKKK